MMTKAELSPIIKEIWAANFYKDLEAKLGISAFINRDYEGEITGWGDTVHISYITDDSDADVLISDNQPYNDGHTSVDNLDLKIQKKAVKAMRITDWARYVSNPAYQDEVRHKLEYKVLKAIEEKILAAINPAGGMSQGSVATLDITHFTQARKAMINKNVPDDGQWIAILGTDYMEDLLNTDEIISKDYFSTETASPMISGKVTRKIYGFSVYETTLISATNAFFWHPSFMTLAIQKGADYKEMDLEAVIKIPAKRVRVETLFDLKQMDGNRVFKVYNT